MAFFKSRRAVGADPGAQPGAADAVSLEHGGLQEDRAGIGPHHRTLTAHDAGQDERLLGVGDEQIARRQGVRLAIQGGEGFAGSGRAHRDLLTSQVAQVKSMHRLAQFEHHIVGHIDEQTEGPDATGFEPGAHPIRRDVVRDALHHRTAPGGAAVVADGGAPAGGRVGPAQVGQLGRGQAQGGRHLAGPAALAPQIGAVGQGVVLDREHGVAAAKEGSQRRARHMVVGQDEDALVAAAKAKLVLGTDHALARLAAQLGGFDREFCAIGRAQRGPDRGHRDGLPDRDIRRAADDWQRRRAAHIDSGAAQLVGVGMLDAGQHLAHHHAIQARPGALNLRLNLGHGRRQPRLQFRG